MLPTMNVTTSKTILRNVPLQLIRTEASSCRCCYYSASSTVSQQEEPFYGKPRYASNFESSKKSNHLAGHNHRHRSIQDRIVIAIHSATTAFADPTRADAVAALGEITGPVTLQRMYQRMMEDETGRLILQERPVVSKVTIPYQELIDSAPDDPHSISANGITFGQAYGSFLKSHGFDPDERDEVKYVEDETLAYVMLRYRQVRCNTPCCQDLFQICISSNYI